MKQSEIVTKVKNALLLDIAVAEYHKSLIAKLKWNPRKDGKPRAKFKESLSDDPYLQAAVFAYCDGEGDFRFGFNSIAHYTTNTAMATDIFKKFDIYQIPCTTYIFKNFCPRRLVNGAMTPVPLFKESKERFDGDDADARSCQFSDALAAYIKATVDFRKEFFDLTKHRTIASTLMDISDYEWTSLARGD